MPLHNNVYNYKYLHNETTQIWMKLLDIFVSNDSEKLLKLPPVLFSTILQCKQIMPERQDLQPLTPSKATTLRLTTFWLGPLSQALACLIFQQKPTKSWSGVVKASWGIFRKRFNQETHWSVSFTAIFPHLVLGGDKMKNLAHQHLQDIFQQRWSFELP